MATKDFISSYGIPWRDTGLCSYYDGLSMRCYIWYECCLLVQKNNVGQVTRREYILPNGKCFNSEYRLLAYLQIPAERQLTDEEGIKPLEEIDETEQD